MQHARVKKGIIVDIVPINANDITMTDDKFQFEYYIRIDQLPPAQKPQIGYVYDGSKDTFATSAQVKTQTATVDTQPAPTNSPVVKPI